jgi:endonuclease YncB( thermonuclease family)
MLKTLWAALLALFTPPEPGQTVRARITSVQDGDSVEFAVGLRAYRGRITGIDAPEYSQAFGPEAMQHLVKLAYASRDVTVEHIGYDKFNRMLVRVKVGEVDLALGMLEAGLAWHVAAYSKQLRPLDAYLYQVAHYHAHEARRGLWSQPHPMSPAHYRATLRGEVPYQRKAKQGTSQQGDLFTGQ